MLYPVDSGFSVLVFFMLLFGLPLIFVLKGVAYLIWQDGQEREAERRIKKALGEE